MAESTNKVCKCGKEYDPSDALLGEAIMCKVCTEEYWSEWCEECGALPEDPCEPDCWNAALP